MIQYIFRISIFSFLLVSCKSKVEKINPAEEKITESVYASGTIKTKNQYQVFSSTNGIVDQVLVKEGDLIKKGAPIIRLANSTIELTTENARIAAEYSSIAANTEKLTELKNNIELAKSKMDNDALLLERQRNLWAQQIGTRNELDQRELAYRSSVNAFEASKLRYAQLQKQISFQAKQSQKNLQISKTLPGITLSKASSRGKYTAFTKRKGEMVNTQTPVALVGDASSFMLELQVDEYDITRIKPGQKILVSMDSYKGMVFEAVVEKIVPLMNERSKSFTIEAAFIKQPPALYPNLTCEANIVIQEKEKALTIPRSYLLTDESVLLANKEKRKVTTGLKDYQKVEILSGLTVNDVILKPAQ